MELRDICRKAEEKTGLSQNKLAERIGLEKTALSHALAGRRKLPAEAAIELWEITGIHPKEILAASARIAACIALAVVTLLVTPPEKAQANQMLANADSMEYKLSRFREWLSSVVSHLASRLRAARPLRCCPG